jgi:malate dehydrogenase (oxaloacetate-decarboxylating)
MSTSGPDSADAPDERPVALHRLYRGKIQTALKVPVRGLEDLAVWYTPGVAAASLAIARDIDAVYEQTNRGNTVAIVSDGSRVLGLGDIGPEAALPVMEGKALLFKYLGGVDAVPLCVRSVGTDDLVRTVEALEPSFAAFNLEDISSPACFEMLRRLRARLRVPIWHDDQQGTAAVVLAALRNALRVVGKNLREIRLALIGVGAANVASYYLLRAAGLNGSQVIACDRAGTLHPNRADIEQVRDRYADKWRICTETNPRAVAGGIAEALDGADVCVAFSTPGPSVIRPEWIERMAGDAIVFACANPTPEVWPSQALQAGARVVATGRSDLPNQLNNSLVFPALFRGVLDVRASAITDEMAIVAAYELAAFAEERGLSAGHILPTMEEWEVFPRVAAAVGMKAQEQGLARVSAGHDELHERARARIAAARAMVDALRSAGLIADPPE